MPEHDVVLLTNFVPPYRVTLYQALEQRLGTFRIVVSTAMEADRPWETQYDGLKVEIQKTLTLRRLSNHPYGFRDAIYVHIPYDTLGRIGRLKPDVILSDELGARTAQAMIYRRLHPRSRLIIWATVSEHSEEGRAIARRILRSALLPFTDAVVVNGTSGARYIKRFGLTDEKIFIAPQVTDNREFCRLPLERQRAERRRLIYVGRLIELKNLSPFLSLLSIWCGAHPTVDVEFWMVGDGPEREKLKAAVLPPNLGVRFFGNVAYDGLPAFYAQAGILVFPTLADTWGLVVNEAMAAGLPVLGSLHSQAVEELVRDGATGWTFRPNCTDEMYAAIDRALTTDRGQLRQMGALARKAVEHLTPEFTAERMMDAIRFVCGEKRNQAMPMGPLIRKSSA